MEKDMLKLFESFRYKHDLFTVFSDFIEMGSIAISNSIDLRHYEQRENKYLELIKKYDKEEQELFSKLLGCLTHALDREPDDVLGRIFMQLELSNSWRGQFFTPMSVSLAMAHMTLSNCDELIKEKGYITVNEPAAGGGVTIISLALALKEKGYNYQQCMRVVAQDIDIKAVHMCYLQLSLLGIDAIVMRGDTLLYKFDEDVWRTPAHMLGWTRQKNIAEVVEFEEEQHYEQLTLFDEVS